jgi:hypothetical protein
MGDLPDDENGKEDQARGIKVVRCRCPAHQRRHGSWNGANEDRRGGHALQRGVHEYVREDREKSECRRQKIRTCGEDSAADDG